MSSKIAIALIVLIGSALALPSDAQDEKTQWLQAHNDARAQVSVPPMAWSSSLASRATVDARQLARFCKPVYSVMSPYGENIAVGGSELSINDFVSMWVDEKADCDYKSNLCTPLKICSHYTQVVWCNSAQVGCARAACSSKKSIVVCYYNPRGNVIGQKPY